MNNLNRLNNYSKGKSPLSNSKDITNHGVTEKLLQKHLNRKVFIGIEKSGETIKETTNS